MRIGDYEVRPAGGAWGCLLMILFSIALSVFLTLAINAFFR